MTLTFDPKKAFPVGGDRASREALWWCGQTGRLLRKPIGWIYATERGDSGLWHTHALLIGTCVQSLTAPAAMWTARNGRISSQPVHNVRGAALYTTKSAALAGEIVLSDTMSLYRASLQDVVHIPLHLESKINR